MTPTEIQAECRAIAESIGPGAYVKVSFLVDMEKERGGTWSAGASRFMPIIEGEERQACEGIATVWRADTPQAALANLANLVADASHAA
jgi:hypothetical protein